MKYLAALLVALLSAHTSAVETTGPTTLEGTWVSQDDYGNGVPPELQLRAAGDNFSFSFKPQGRPAAFIFCHKPGTFAAKLVARSPSELTFTVAIDPSSQYCSAVKVECARVRDDVLDCSWVGRARYSLRRGIGE